MNQIYTSTIIRTSRLIIGIIIFSIFSPLLLTPGLRQVSPFHPIILPLVIGLLIFIFIRSYVSAKLVIRQYADRLDFEFKRRFLFDNRIFDPVNVKDIVLLVVDNGEFLRKIITKNQNLEINNIKPVTDNYRSFIDQLIKIAQSNNGRVINSKQYSIEKGMQDLSFHLFIILLAFSIFLTLNLWAYIGPITLFIFIFPLYAFLKHVKLRVRKDQFIRDYLDNDTEKELEINKFINQINFLSNNTSDQFHDVLLEKLTNTVGIQSNPLFKKYYKELSQNVKILKDYFDKVIESDFSYESVEVFMNRYYEKINHEYCVYLVNIKLAGYWYYIFKKLNQEISDSNNTERINLSKEVITDLKETAIGLNAIKN